MDIDGALAKGERGANLPVRFPAATSRNTSTSRAVSPWGYVSCRGARRAVGRATPRRSKSAVPASAAPARRGGRHFAVVLQPAPPPERPFILRRAVLGERERGGELFGGCALPPGRQ